MTINSKFVEYDSDNQSGVLVITILKSKDLHMVHTGKGGGYFKRFQLQSTLMTDSEVKFEIMNRYMNYNRVEKRLDYLMHLLTELSLVKGEGRTKHIFTPTLVTDNLFDITNMDVKSAFLKVTPLKHLNDSFIIDGLFWSDNLMGLGIQTDGSIFYETPIKHNSYEVSNVKRLTDNTTTITACINDFFKILKEFYQIIDYIPFGLLRIVLTDIKSIPFAFQGYIGEPVVYPKFNEETIELPILTSIFTEEVIKDLKISVLRKIFPVLGGNPVYIEDMLKRFNL
jgi:hypothetical protein